MVLRRCRDKICVAAKRTEDVAGLLATGLFRHAVSLLSSFLSMPMEEFGSLACSAGISAFSCAINEPILALLSSPKIELRLCRIFPVFT